jgi:hypothetical protein
LYFIKSKMNRVLFEDGKGNLTDEDGVEVSVVDMEVDEIECCVCTVK